MSICGWAQGMRAGVQKEDQAGCITQETCHPLPAPWSASSSSPQEVVTGYWKVKSRAGWDKPQNTAMSSPHSSRSRRKEELRDSHPSGSCPPTRKKAGNGEWGKGGKSQQTSGPRKVISAGRSGSAFTCLRRSFGSNQPKKAQRQ